VRRLGTLFLLSVLVLGACGDRDDVPVFRRLDGPPEGIRLEVRVLDPAGRLLDHPRGAVVRMRDPATGAVLRGPLFKHVPDDAELVVLAPGCPAATVPAQSAGVQFVRVERGIPIRLRLLDREPLPAGLSTLDVGLVRKPRSDSWWAGEIHERVGAWARWMNDDLPTGRDHVRVPAESDVIGFYVPGPGAYRLGWHTSWGNQGVSWPMDEAVEVGMQDGGRVFEVAMPAGYLDELGQRARREAVR